MQAVTGRGPAVSHFHERRVVQLVGDGIMRIDLDGSIWKLAQKCRRGGFKALPSPRRAETISNRGYLRVCVTLDFGQKHTTCAAHRLVWQYFNGDIPDGMVINHKNGIKTDNRPENLEVVEPLQNYRHAVENKLVDNNGQLSATAKLTAAEVNEVRQRIANGENVKEIAHDYGVTRGSIYKAARGSGWRNVDVDAVEFPEATWRSRCEAEQARLRGLFNQFLEGRTRNWLRLSQEIGVNRVTLKAFASGRTGVTYASAKRLAEFIGAKVSLN